MCGLAGVLAFGGGVDPEVARQMAATLTHRGPDAAGAWHESGDRLIAFGFRRLSIIDVEGGDQPLHSEDGQVVAMVNGEIYDYVETRDVLRARGHRFATASDAEVVVHAYEEWGLDFVQHLRGMFALAVWDRRVRRLVLARDRLGQKPLYWSYDAARGELALASETRALLPWAGFDHSIDKAALDEYLTFLQIPGRRSIYRHAQKLPPAHLLVVDAANGAREPEPVRYWSPEATTVPGGDLDEAIRSTLDGAVRLRLRSDVPLGVFLSGGIDSTLVAALAARHGTVDTFSLGFEDPRFDESNVARRTAEMLGTRHHEVRMDAGAFSADELVELVQSLDEPFADSSFLPTWWLSRFTGRHVTVALSGDGGDELFAGYTRYRTFRRLERLARLPGPALSALAAGSATGRRFPGAAGDWARRLGKAARLARRPPAGRILGLLEYFTQADKDDLVQPAWRRSDGSTCECLVARQLSEVPRRSDPLERLLVRDLMTNLPDDALVKVDRASMACSLEVRSPLLDHRFVEVALSIPAADKLAGGVSKRILRRVFADLLPEHVLTQPKRGFEVPFARWFGRRDWRDLLVDALGEERLRRQGIFRPEAVLALRDLILDNPEARRLDLSAYQLRHRVWALLVFQLWIDRWIRS